MGNHPKCSKLEDYPLLDVTPDLSRIDDLDNTWNAYRCNINETVVLENAIFLNKSGLLEAGYNYFVLDGISLANFHRPYHGYRIQSMCRIFDVDSRLLDGKQKIQERRLSPR